MTADFFGWDWMDATSNNMGTGSGARPGWCCFWQRITSTTWVIALWHTLGIGSRANIYIHLEKIGSGQTGDKQLAHLLKSHLFQSESIIFSATELTLNIITHVNMDTCGLHGLALNNTYCRVFRTLEFYPCQTIHQ